MAGLVRVRPEGKNMPGLAKRDVKKADTVHDRPADRDGMPSAWSGG